MSPDPRLPAPNPRNVILFVGDGMGDSEITLARNYLKGAGGRLTIDRLTHTCDCTTYSVRRGDPDSPVYVTDSSAAATAWSTGTKTYNGAIGVDAFMRPLPTLVEIAHGHGLRTGLVTTEELCDSTPAAMVAHVSDRFLQGPDATEGLPEDRAGGGLGSIAEQMVRARPDVLFGGGARHFHQQVRDRGRPGRTVLDEAVETGYRVVFDAEGMAAAGPGGPVLGLFADSVLERRWLGPTAVPGGTPPTACVLNPDRPAGQPSLPLMLRSALDLLDVDDGPGFFLLVESGQIDNASHEADACGIISEMEEFDEAVGAGLEYADARGDTLVVVLADHGHTSQIVPTDVECPGASVCLVTREGSPMKVNYSTNLPGEIQVHTGTQVRVGVHGPGSDPFRGLIDNTDVFSFVTAAWAAAREDTLLRGGDAVSGPGTVRNTHLSSLPSRTRRGEADARTGQRPGRSPG